MGQSDTDTVKALRVEIDRLKHSLKPKAQPYQDNLKSMAEVSLKIDQIIAAEAAER